MLFAVCFCLHLGSDASRSLATMSAAVTFLPLDVDKRDWQTSENIQAILDHLEREQSVLFFIIDSSARSQTFNRHSNVVTEHSLRSPPTRVLRPRHGYIYPCDSSEFSPLDRTLPPFHTRGPTSHHPRVATSAIATGNNDPSFALF